MNRLINFLSAFTEGAPIVMHAVLREARREWLFLLSLSMLCIATQDWFALLLVLSRPIHAASARSAGQLEGLKATRGHVAAVLGNDHNGEDR